MYNRRKTPQIIIKSPYFKKEEMDKMKYAYSYIMQSMRNWYLLFHIGYSQN